MTALFDALEPLDALRMIARDAECSMSMVGGCVGATHPVHRAKDGEFVRIEEVGCAKHFAREYLATRGETWEL